MRISQRQTLAHWLMRIGQIAIGVDPVLVRGPDDGLGGRSDDERLFQLLAARVRHDRALRRETLDVFRLLLQETFRNEHREIRVDVPRLLEHPVEIALHVLPHRVAVWV